MPTARMYIHSAHCLTWFIHNENQSCTISNTHISYVAPGESLIYTRVLGIGSFSSIQVRSHRPFFSAGSISLPLSCIVRDLVYSFFVFTDPFDYIFQHHQIFFQHPFQTFKGVTPPPGMLTLPIHKYNGIFDNHMLSIYYGRDMNIMLNTHISQFLCSTWTSM